MVMVMTIFMVSANEPIARENVSMTKLAPIEISSIDFNAASAPNVYVCNMYLDGALVTYMSGNGDAFYTNMWLTINCACSGGDIDSFHIWAVIDGQYLDFGMSQCSTPIEE